MAKRVGRPRKSRVKRAAGAFKKTRKANLGARKRHRKASSKTIKSAVKKTHRSAKRTRKFVGPRSTAKRFKSSYKRGR